MLNYFQIMDRFKSWFLSQNASKFRIREFYEDGKPWIVPKMVWGLIENEPSLTVQILEKK